jgi:pimeloyl-ACP methyl ester carboxylesterase
MDTWNPSFIAVLARHNQVRHLRQPRHRLLRFIGKGILHPVFCDDTLQLIAALAISRANVLGYSRGAMTAQELALRSPERVNRMVLVSGDCGGSHAVRMSPEV